VPNESDNPKGPGLLARILGRGRTQADRSPRLLESETNRSAVPDPGVLYSELPYNYGRETGWLESNEQFTPEFLHGDQSVPGKLLEIRRTDDVIGPAMDSRRELLSGYTFPVIPRERFAKDPLAKRAALDVGIRLNSLYDRTLPDLMGEVYDYRSTSGLSVFEIVLEQDNRIRLAPIRPGLIRRFVQDETGHHFRSIVVNARNYGEREIPEEKLFYVSRFPQPGEFWGDSAIRCMVATSETTLQLYSALLQSIRYSMGFPWIGETGNGLSSKNDKTGALKAMSKLLRGESDIVFFGKALEPKILSSQVPAMQQFGPLAQHQAERKQSAVKNALSNLGMRGVGSRSLGETVSDNDRREVRAHFDQFMRDVSASRFLRTVTELCGHDPVYTPQIVIDWMDGDEERTLDRVNLVSTLIKDGVLTSTPEIVGWVEESIGIPGSPPVPEGEDVISPVEPLAVGSLTAAIQTLQALTSPDPSTRLAPATVEQILQAAGVSADSAAAMVSAQLGVLDD